MRLPLAGITVLEFSQYLAGPYCGLRLADLGARVIKIERPKGGDACRQLAPKNLFADGDSLVFHAVNRNKESYAADLKNPEDLERVKELIARADILTHNFRPGVMEKLGLDYTAAKKIKPDLIYAQVSGYTAEGPWRHKPGQDLLAQAVSGLTWLTGSAGDPPTPMGLAVGDMLCGTHLAQGILAALVRRNRTGAGALVQVSLLESLLDFQFEVLSIYYNHGGKDPERSAVLNAHAYLDAPYGIYPTKDGHIALAMGSLARLADLLQCPEIQKYSEESNDFSKRDAIKETIAKQLRHKTTAAWLEILKGKYWCSDVYNYKRLLGDPAYRVLQMEQEVERPDSGIESKVKTLRCPIRIDGRRLYNPTAAPVLGSGNEAIDVEHETEKLSPPSRPPASEPQKPLESITVLDFSQFLSGPSASLRLADLGAKVIKVERPETGDLSRQLYASEDDLGGVSTFFQVINRNKYSIAIDLKSEQGLQSIGELLPDCDVLIHNFRPGVMERLGLGYEQVRQKNPKIIYGAISGYGTEGSWSADPGQDLLVQALSGLTWLSGNKNGPVPMGLAIVDMLSGAQLAQGILAALAGKFSSKEEKSTLLEASLLEAALDLQLEPLTFHFQDGGAEPERTESNNAHAYLGAPYGIYATKDGHLALAMGSVVQLGELLNCPALLDYRVPAQWFSARNEIKTILAKHLLLRSTEKWLSVLEPADIWCAPVLRWKELFQSEAYSVLQMEQEVQCGNKIRYKTTRCPIRIDGKFFYSSLGAPQLGEHQAQIQVEYGIKL